MEFDNPNGSKSSNTIVKRPMTAFFSNNNTIQNIGEQNFTSQQWVVSRNEPGLSLNDPNETIATQKNRIKSGAKQKKRVTDPEGIEALNDLDKFEKSQCKKKDNRYAKVNLEQHLSLDETMAARIKARAKITQAKFETNMSKFSHRRLANGFKSVKLSQENYTPATLTKEQSSNSN